MLAGQAEFRRELFWRLGAVAFLGAGEVGKTFGDFNASNLVLGGGIGLRYQVTKKTTFSALIEHEQSAESLMTLDATSYDPGNSNRLDGQPVSD